MRLAHARVAAALIALQSDCFSCPIHMIFNRNSSLQVAGCVAPSRNLFVSSKFSAASSLLFPSFHVSPLIVVFGFIEANETGATAGVTQAFDHAIDRESEPAY